jgi:hypothetical protein
MSLKIIKRQPWTLASNTPLPLAQTNSDTQSDTTSFPFLNIF